MRRRSSTPPAQQPVLVVSKETGLVYRSALDRVQGGLTDLPSMRSLLDADHRGMWGARADWTDDLVQQSLVRLVSEGLSLRKALATLEDQNGPMPSFFRINAWLERDKAFHRDMVAAERCAAEILSDAALEVALEEPGLVPALVAAQKTRVAALQWRASKLHRDKFGETSKVEIADNRPYQAVSKERLLAELAALLSDPMVQRVSGSDIQDAEEVPQPTLPPPAEAQGPPADA